MRTILTRSMIHKGIAITILLFTAMFPVYSGAVNANENQSPLLVDVGWLQDHMKDPNMVIVDTRAPGDYNKKHISGAVNLPSIRTFHNSSKERVASEQQIEMLLGNLGIKNESFVVVYGDSSYLDSPRTFWALDLYGHEKLALLNGAFPAWEKAGLPVDANRPARRHTTYRAVIQPGRLSTRLQTQLSIKTPETTLIDSRNSNEYKGLASKASRFGHIPSAINIPKKTNLETRQGIIYYKNNSALEHLYEDVDSENRIILYCNSGTEAAINYLALCLLNRKTSIYDGAWHEWGNDPSLPIVSPAR